MPELSYGAIAFFAILVGTALWFDLLSHKKDQPITVRSASLWTGFWVALAIVFYIFLHVGYGAETASLFASGYVLEQSLSVDNLMVFMMIFASFKITGALQHRILYFGILGAIIFRLIFVLLGTGLFAITAWAELVFGLIVLWTVYKMIRDPDGDGEDTTDYSQHWSVRWTQKIMPVRPTLDGHNFFSTLDKKWAVTPLFLCLICIEACDIIFAFDSVPAVIAVTQVPFLVYAAMIFAILGLRSMYFVLEAASKYLVHLTKAVIVVLFFVAAKLIGHAAEKLVGFPMPEISPNLSMGIVLGTLAVGILASFVLPATEPKEA